MTILIAPDKFKGSLTAKQVCQAIFEGLLSINPALSIISCPLADGGEGTSELLTSYSGGSTISIRVLDPLFREVESSYGISGDTHSAFIEMAKASGLTLLSAKERNPLYTSTYGTGQLIVDAMERGCKKIILGIGGSATNDGGMGMAEALGYSFHDQRGKKIKPIGENLGQISSINTSHVHPLVSKTEFIVLCDVENPLVGNTGAAAVFGPQKGADAKAIEILDKGLRQFKKVAESTFNTTADFPGAGAAGGLGGGARVFLNAHMLKGFDFISDFTQLENSIRRADIIITGEGKIDAQSLSGKVVSGVAQLCAKHNKRCIAFTGKCDLTHDEAKALNLEKIISISNEKTTVQESMNHAFSMLKARTASHYTDLIP